ncbi:MAG: GntR family transcriptional regulator [Planctomycetaceae bacterium]
MANQHCDGNGTPDLPADHRPGSACRCHRGVVPGNPYRTVRGLAEQLVINANTVAKSYSELVREGVLESRQSRGYFVAPKRQIYTKAERMRRLRQAANAYVSEAISLDFTADEIHGVITRCLDSHGWMEESTETTT